MNVWYKTDVTRLSCGLLRAQSAGSLAFALLLLRHKLLRREPPASVGVKLDSAFLPFELEELPELAAATLKGMIDECSQRGCSLVLCHTSEFLGDAESYGANLLHKSGKIWLSALWFRVGQRIESGYSVCSQLADGTILTTTNLRRRSDVPPGMETRSFPGATLDELWERHADALREAGEQTVASFDAPQLLERLVDIRQRIRNFHLDCGILKPMSLSEIRRLDPSAYVAAQANFPDEASAAEVSAAGDGRRLVLRTALLGLMLGALLGQLLLWRMQLPQDPGRLEFWPIGFHTYGWALLGALAGAGIGFLRLESLQQPRYAGPSPAYRSNSTAPSVAAEPVRSV